VPDRCRPERYRRKMEGHHPMAIVGWADENERTEEEYPSDHRANASPSPAGNDGCWNSRTSPGARFAPASAVFANAVRDDVGTRVERSLHMGQRASQT